MEIDASLVRRLVDAQFPEWAELPIERVEHDGWDNRTFRLGDEMSVRLPSAECYAAQVAKEHAWLPRLRPQLPLAIPVPLARGGPGEGYPWHWSVYRWLAGKIATQESFDDLTRSATELARFLGALHRLDASDGPPPGAHNFFRGGPVATYDAETRESIQALHDRNVADAATVVWEKALETSWQGAPVWIHGDVAAGNLLVSEGRLCAVIDFGCAGVGDPACDLTIAWTLFAGASREAFRAALGFDEATWARARGWALWKALITDAQDVVEDVLADHARVTGRAETGG